MKVIIKLKDDTESVVDLGAGEQLDKFDYIISTFRSALVSKGEIQFKNGVRKFEEVESIEIIVE